MRILCIAVLLFGFGIFAGESYALTRNDNEAEQQRLRLVQKIYVGEMGKTDEADRFRLLLAEQLSKKGFMVVDRAEDSDAILTGALSVRVLDEKSEARVYVTLDTPGGARLWAKDFGHRTFTNPFKRKEPTRRRAEEVADGLRKDLKK